MCTCPRRKSHARRSGSATKVSFTSRFGERTEAVLRAAAAEGLANVALDVSAIEEGFRGDIESPCGEMVSNFDLVSLLCKQDDVIFLYGLLTTSIRCY